MTVVEKQLPALPECLSDARHLLDAHASRIPSEKVEHYRLLVSEVLSTVLRRSADSPPLSVYIELGRHSALIEVRHSAPRCGDRFEHEDDLSSRALDRLSSAWGAEEHPRMVWFSLDW